MDQHTQYIIDAIREARVTAQMLPKSREAAMVLTKLDEAYLWANVIVTPLQGDR